MSNVATLSFCVILSLFILKQCIFEVAGIMKCMEIFKVFPHVKKLSKNLGESLKRAWNHVYTCMTYIYHRQQSSGPCLRISHVSWPSALSRKHELQALWEYRGSMVVIPLGIMPCAIDVHATLFTWTCTSSNHNSKCMWHRIVLSRINRSRIWRRLMFVPLPSF